MYPVEILKSEATAARRRVPVWLVDATDGVTAETGVSGTPRISKNGGASAAATNAITEVDATNMPGLYYAELTAGEVDTLGQVLISFKTAATAQWHGSAKIVAFDPHDAVRMGLGALPNAAADAAGGLPISDAGGLDIDTKLAATNEITAARMGALTDWIDAGRLDAILDAIKAVTDQFSFGVANMVDANLEAINLQESSADRFDIYMRNFEDGLAQAGAASSITLAAGESAQDDQFAGQGIMLHVGTGQNQAMRIITAYNGTTKVATVHPPWTVVPDGTTRYLISHARVDLTTISLDGAAADNLEADYDGTGYDKANSKVGTATALGANAITAAAIAAAALDGKGDWNIGKTGYGLTQAFPANFADLAIEATTGQVDANVIEWLGTAVTAATAGRPDTNSAAIDGSVSVAQRFNDWLIKGLRQTADSGTTTTLVDAALTQGDQRWRGALLIFRSGSNDGYTAIVTDFDAASDTITFTPAVPTGVTTESYTLIPGLGWAMVQAWLGAVPNALVGGAVDADVSAVQAGAADTIRDAILPTQNAAFDNLGFLFVAASDHVTPVTGATGLAVTRSIDGGAFAAGTGTLG